MIIVISWNVGKYDRTKLTLNMKGIEKNWRGILNKVIQDFSQFGSRSNVESPLHAWEMEEVDILHQLVTFYVCWKLLKMQYYCTLHCLFESKEASWDTCWQGKVCWATLGVQMVRKGARHSVTISFPPLPCPIHHLSSGLVRPGGELAGNELSVLSSSPLLHCVLVGGNELSVLSYRPLCPAESQHWPVTCSIWGQDTNTCNTYVILPPTSEKYG